MGQGQETYGEDPFLTSSIGVAFVRGLQGNDGKYFKIIATPKHYAVHSGPEGSRHRFNVQTTKRDLVLKLICLHLKPASGKPEPTL